MKIWGENPKVFGVYNQNNKVGSVNINDVVSTRMDEYKISSHAKDYQTAMQALRNIPDIRSGKVQEISHRIETGKYKVRSIDISDKIINKMLSGN